MKLTRDSDGNGVCTLGVLTDVFGAVMGQTLEPPDAGNARSISCIPAGTYRARLRYSPSHGYAVYGLLNVPGRDNIEIHSGNTIADTKGCILLGSARGTNSVINSRLALGAFMARQGVPLYRDLRDWDAVRDFILANPQSAEFVLEIV